MIYINVFNLDEEDCYMYIAYDTPTSKCSCLSTILKIKAILAK